ncbi:uncharacterized protein LOC128177526 [Crassostrea angulata]|uniref:uncharacterized protein LOC128177526 n=1 Tax=Magallana angulata TaxID=2784310 RepID=UPI0022B09E0D|nr:uncharacterized protein LOC128177526 [Crassostrea angulata]
MMAAQKKLAFFGFKNSKEKRESTQDQATEVQCNRKRIEDESNPKENSSPSSSSEVLGSSPQVPSSCPQVPGSSSQASSSSSQVKSHSISEVTDLFPEKHVHHHDICETKCFESSKSFCLTEKENKKTYKLQHSWLENKMSYCETINLWWAIFSEGEGLYCYLCRKHDTMNTQNKTKDFQQRSKRIQENPSRGIH